MTARVGTAGGAGGLAVGGALLSLAGCSDYTFRQPEWTDAFVQDQRQTVDILLIVDNSCSMIEEQQKLADNFEDFIAAFEEADVDWQIGVVTTDIDDEADSGRIRGSLITSTEMESEGLEATRDRFADTVNVGTSGSGLEAGLEAARLALSPELLAAENAGLLREEAGLSIVAVSDEEDTSPDPVDLYLDFFFAVKSPNGFEAYRDDAILDFSAVVGPVPDGCQLTGADQYPAQPGERYLDLVTRTGGLFNSICDENFGPIVEELGLTISGLRSEFYLSRWPDLATLVVEVDGVPQTEWWEYLPDHNSVLFDLDHLPASQSVIEITYTVVARPTGSGASP